MGRPKLAGVAGLSDTGDVRRYATADPLSGEQLPTDAEGELVSTGPTHMLGFWDEPAQTAACMSDGWVYSGDLGRVDEHGYLHLTGRSKELYTSGGELVMPKEVEELIAAHPGVSQVYAIGVPDERWGEAGFAFVVLEPEVRVTADDLLGLCKRRLANFKVPKQVCFIAAEDLPVTPTGKVQKFRLVERAVATLAAARP